MVSWIKGLCFVLLMVQFFAVISLFTYHKSIWDTFMFMFMFFGWMILFWFLGLIVLALIILLHGNERSVKKDIQSLIVLSIFTIVSVMAVLEIKH